MFDDLQETRRCPQCHEPLAKLAMTTAHSVDVTAGHVVPLGSVDQGMRIDYRCEGCGHGFSLLDRMRRAWCAFGVVIGAAFSAFALWLGADGQALLMLGAATIAFGASAFLLGRDTYLRRITRI